MTDRELLEAAAKAAGKKVHTRNQAGRDACGAGDVGLWISEGQTCWNPLTNSGDAFELAVKLRLTLNCSYDDVAICGQEFTQKEAFIERNGEDPYAATRRAIVRAAAAIGKEHEMTEPIESQGELK
jgi:hypothetical protein